MTALLAKLPISLRDELEQIRRRFDGPFSPSAQTIFDEHIGTIDKTLALGATHAELAGILFELGLSGYDGKQLKAGSVSKCLSRSRRPVEAEISARAGGGDPGSVRQNAAPQSASDEVSSVDADNSVISERSGALAPGADRALTPLPSLEANELVAHSEEGAALCRVPSCPAVRHRALAPALNGLGGACSDVAIQDKDRQDSAPLDKPRHGATLHSVNCGIGRQSPAERDRVRHCAQLPREEDGSATLHFTPSAGATDLARRAAAATEIATAPAHAAQAQFPIPPPLTPGQHFDRACAAGQFLIKLKAE